LVLQGAVEGSVDEALLRRLLVETGHQASAIYGLTGKDGLLKRLDAYNAAARISPWVVLIDLNGDARCAPPFVAQHLPVPSEYMTFRVAVREAEAWLLADRRTFAGFLGVSQARLPRDPEAVADPKEEVEFITRHWQPQSAAARSDSLRRSLDRLAAL